MKLESFRITNFRSISDSGQIDVSEITALLGRNESGKSNLLLALRSLKPAEGFRSLHPIKDFPRHRRLEECDDNTEVVHSRWSLSDGEKSELKAILPRAAKVTHVNIGRRYGKQRWVSFEKLASQQFNESEIKSKIRKIVPAIKAAAAKLDATLRPPLEQSAGRFEKAIVVVPDRTVWASNAVKALAELRQALAAADTDLTEKQERLVADLEELAEAISGDRESQQRARDWIAGKMPVFVYLDEYPELNGHQNIAAFLRRKADDEQSDADINFEKLCKVAGLDPEALHELLTQKEPETRNQLANRASAVVTTEIKRLWQDRPLKIRFNLDAEHLDTLISDPNATYDVEVNLDERSRGFKWFFSFYITFSADTDGGEAEDAILLLDEPGLYLHARSQSDLLNHLEKDFKNQIIYTTHSPFMVPTHNLDAVRTVNISEVEGTKVTNDPTGDSRTLFPLQAALGYNLAQSLFVGPSNLVVEGVTDYWILTAVSDYLAEFGKISLSSDLTITPAGGAQKVPYMVALLTSERLNVLVLLDEERSTESTRDHLVKSKLIREKNVVFVSEAFEGDGPVEADIEDLIDADAYVTLVEECYSSELNGKSLALNPEIPRMTKRIEAAMSEFGVVFHKTRPARLLIQKMRNEPDSIIFGESLGRFERLFSTVNGRLRAHIERDSRPFL